MSFEGKAAIVAGADSDQVLPDVPVFATRPTAFENGEIWPTLEEARRAEMAIRLRQIDLTPLVSTVVPLDEAIEGYRLAIEEPPGTRSVLLKP